VRLFLAVFPSPATRALAAHVIDGLRKPGDGVSWVKEDNLHYTMRFIGEVGEDGASRVAQAADEAAAGVPAFDAVLGDLGAFPGVRKARVIWVGLSTGGDALKHLAERLATALDKRGWERERQKFQAHLTLGRVREPDRDWGPVFASAPTLSGERDARFRVSGLQVVVSQLNPKGSIYTVRHEAKLSG
jgi:RNA 2',3'-cyclic 3'-phosphodiesterase